MFTWNRGNDMSRSWAGGSTRRWRTIRREVLRANANANRGRCALDVGTYCPRHDRSCFGVCTGVANTVHHADGKRAGDRIDRLVACCAECNGHVGAPGEGAAPRPRSRW